MAALAIDELIDGKYRIVRLLGTGAWASVYEGVNLRLRRRVAIKVLGKEMMSRPGIVERFEREGQAVTRIDSPHVVDVFDIGTLPDGQPYMVMEFLDGEDLGKLFEKTGALPPERAVFYTVQALRGLADAHEAGVLHRDIKPANVVVVKKQGEEIVKIVDFGISKLDPGAVPQAGAMTQTNAVLGSPVYMSPEQCRGARQMDHRSDIYSVGVLLYEALTGRVPHSAETFNELMFKIALEDVPDPRAVRPDLDADLVAILMKALARDVDKRYASARAFRAALIEWAEKNELNPSKWPGATVGTVVVRELLDRSESSSKLAADNALAQSGERRQDAGSRGVVVVPSSDTPAAKPASGAIRATPQTEATGTPDGNETSKAHNVGLAETLAEAPSPESKIADEEAQAESQPLATGAPEEPHPAAAERSAEELARRKKAAVAGAIASVAALVVIAFTLTRGQPTDSASAAASASAARPAASATSPAATPTPTAVSSTPAASDVDDEVNGPASTTTAPNADVARGTAESATAPTRPNVGPTRPLASALASARASAAGSARAPASAARPAASASAKAVIDGRTIHTTF